MAYTLNADKMIRMRVEYVDAAENPAPVDGEVTWDSSDATIASVAVDADDSSLCTVTPGPNLGTAIISALADADLSANVRTVIATIDVTIIAGEAVSGTITPVGDPQPIG